MGALQRWGHRSAPQRLASGWVASTELALPRRRFLVALLAGLSGFGGIASTATGMAQILFVIAIVLFVVSLFAGFVRRNL
jgi:uncharacterized membrane protein YtjA (UPF0391 family)